MIYNSNNFNSFNSIEWDDYCKKIIQRIDSEIKSCNDDYILNVNENDYIIYLTEKYTLTPLAINKESEEVNTPTEFQEDLSQYQDSYEYAIYGRYRNGYSIRISYSYTGNSDLFKVRPNPFTLTCYAISLQEQLSKVSFEIRIYSKDVKLFQREKEEAFRRAFTNVDNINTCVISYNQSIESVIRKIFLSEKKQRLEKNNFFAAIKVKRTTEAPTTYEVPIIKKKDLVKPSSSNTKSFFPEPSLDISTYKNIISEINLLGTSMERKPSLYFNKDEEGLRDMIVTMLETRFEGTTATGETFNHSGKTDILLKNTSDNSNLFIAECKFWHGPKHFKEAINQLFDKYLTWRDSKTALIIFVNGNDFTSVLNSIKENIVSHPYFLKLNEQHSNTSVNYIFHFPKDCQKEVYLEVMAFNFDKNKPVEEESKSSIVNN